MSVADFAEIIGKSVDTLYNLRAAGADLPPCYRFNRRVRMRRTEVDAWLESHREAPAPASQPGGGDTTPSAPRRERTELKPWLSGTR